VSIGDFDYESSVPSDKLIISKTRLDGTSKFKLTLQVPTDVDEDFFAPVTLKNKVNGESTKFAVQFTKKMVSQRVTKP